MISGLKVKLIGVCIVSAVLRYRFIARTNQLHLEGVHNCACNLVLNCKDVLQLAIKGLSPKMITVSHINQLRRYAQPITSFAHTAFQNLRHI